MLPPREPIVRMRDRSPLRFRLAYLARGKPVVLEGLACDWPAIERWTWQRLRQVAGDAMVSTYRVRDGQLDFDASTGLRLERVALSVFLDEVEGRAPPIHRIRCKLDEELHLLRGDIRRLPHVRTGMPVEANLWMSGPRTYSRLHFDQPHNLLVQVMGMKKVILFAPSERRRLYPNPIFSPIAQFSRVDLRAPDPSQFPRLRETKPYETLLGPGDALFIPGGWWHYVESDEPTISVGLRFWPWRRAPLLFAAEVYKRLRGHTH